MGGEMGLGFLQQSQRAGGSNRRIHQVESHEEKADIADNFVARCHRMGRMVTGTLDTADLTQGRDVFSKACMAFSGGSHMRTRLAVYKSFFDSYITGLF